MIQNDKHMASVINMLIMKHVCQISMEMGVKNPQSVPKSTPTHTNLASPTVKL